MSTASKGNATPTEDTPSAEKDNESASAAISPEQDDAASGSPPSGSGPAADDTIDRSLVVGAWVDMAARWSGRLILVMVALVLTLWGLSTLWAGLLPVILALILAALLMPFKQFLLRRGIGHTVSTLVTLITTLTVLLGTFAAIAPDVATQFTEIGKTAQGGVNQLQDWLARGPLDLGSDEIDNAIERATTWIKSRSGDIASGAFSGVSAAGSLLINVILILALTFFFLKDGHRFLGWQRSVMGRGAGRHLTEILTRNWTVLGAFIRTQALVSAIDAVLIGAGLFILGVPLALALTVITFFAGFIPIVGAITAGALAVLVALVSNGWQTALIIVAIIVLVQQLEGNVLSPMLQGKTMQVHPGLILVTVTIGGTLFGIVGVFLAVPLTASLVATARYISEQLNLRTGDVQATDVRTETPEGDMAARDGQSTHAHYQALQHSKAAALGQENPVSRA